MLWIKYKCLQQCVNVFFVLSSKRYSKLFPLRLNSHRRSLATYWKKSWMRKARKTGRNTTAGNEIIPWNNRRRRMRRRRHWQPSPMLPCSPPQLQSLHLGRSPPTFDPDTHQVSVVRRDIVHGRATQCHQQWHTMQCWQ